MCPACVFLREFIQKKIREFLKDKDFDYTSINNFVVKATDNEIRIATFKQSLSSMGKYHFDLLFAEGLKNAYERAIEYDRMIPNSPGYKQMKKNEKEFEELEK